MSHLTNKKKLQKNKNNRLRVFNHMNTGTRDMGFTSNQERKAYLHKYLNKEGLYEI